MIKIPSKQMGFILAAKQAQLMTKQTWPINTANFIRLGEQMSEVDVDSTWHDIGINIVIKQ